MGILHKIFISFHSEDIYYKEKFEQLFHVKFGVVISRSVNTGDIPSGLLTDTVRQKIRDEYLRDSSVTIVLIGANTWQRKHVDWEISSSLRDTPYNSRSGLLGILLPTYPGFDENKYNRFTIPPRLSDNLDCGYSKIYRWTENPIILQDWVHQSYLAKSKVIPHNSYPSFVNNRTGCKSSA